MVWVRPYSVNHTLECYTGINKKQWELEEEQVIGQQWSASYLSSKDICSRVAKL